MENRRRAERRSALCMGSCYVEGEPSDLWRECAIIDVSALGLGIELLHPDPVDLLGLWQDGELRTHVSRRITVRLDLGPSVEMRVAGRVRNAGSGPDGIVRAGVEFVGLTETERSLVDRLVQEVSANRVGNLEGQQTIADSVPVLCEAPESLAEGRARHKVPDPVHLYDDLPASLVEALGGREIADIHPVTWEPPESLIEARAGRMNPDPVSVFDDPPESFVEALGQREIDDPLETWEPPESLIEARGRHRIIDALGQPEIDDPVPVLGDLPERFVEFLERQKEIDDPVPGLSAVPESLADAFEEQEIDDPVPGLNALPESLADAFEEQEIDDPVPGLRELPEGLVEARGPQLTIPDAAPGLSDIARKSGELAFLTLRVIGSDVLGIVGRLPVAPRILNGAGRRARRGSGETSRTGEQTMRLTIVDPVESADPLHEEGF